MIHVSDQPNLQILLLEAKDIEWNPDAPVPQGLTVQNMRGRGIDEYRICISFAKPSGANRFFSGLNLFGKPKLHVTTIIISENQFKLVSTATGKPSERETVIAAGDISMIAVRPASGTSKASLQISFSSGNPVVDSGSMEIGSGLPVAALNWLRSRMLLEAAGLVSRPLYNVGRRTTRRTFNPDDELYMCWPGGPNRLIELFLREAPQKVEGFQAAIRGREWQIAAGCIHWLKSCSAAVGAGQMSELCQRLEIEVESKEASQLGKLNAYFQAEYHKVIDCLTSINNGETPRTDRGNDLSDPGLQRLSGSTLSGMKVLLVEDSLVNQELARDCLEHEGCVVTAARTGEAAIAEFARDRFDLVLMDCQMPGMGGLEATRIIRSAELNGFKPKVPIVALTAHTLRDDRNRCLAVGMNDYLGKPYTSNELVEVLHKWLGEASVAQQVAG